MSTRESIQQELRYAGWCWTCIRNSDYCYQEGAEESEQQLLLDGIAPDNYRTVMCDGMATFECPDCARMRLRAERELFQEESKGTHWDHAQALRMLRMRGHASEDARWALSLPAPFSPGSAGWTWEELRPALSELQDGAALPWQPYNAARRAEATIASAITAAKELYGIEAVARDLHVSPVEYYIVPGSDRASLCCAVTSLSANQTRFIDVRDGDALRAAVLWAAGLGTACDECHGSGRCPDCMSTDGTHPLGGVCATCEDHPGRCIGCVTAQR